MQWFEADDDDGAFKKDVSLIFATKKEQDSFYNYFYYFWEHKTRQFNRRVVFGFVAI